ncbi:MAG: hypothetical protein FJ303_10995 [Planctomycetes bacterium]|nr:hypothetical protein [Planctomycetota bacterium]
MSTRHILLAIAVVVFAGAHGQGDTGGEKSDSKVKATISATKLTASGKQTVTVTLEIEKGWYIYANPVNDEDYEINRTRLSFKAKDKVTALVNYPTGKMKSGAKYFIYEGKVVIESELKRTPGDTGPVEVSIAVNSCGGPKMECLLPGVIKITVP